jgi:hypothetical protein
MKKSKNCNNLFILGISISLLLIIGILMSMNMKENYTQTTIPSDFIPNQIQTGTFPISIDKRDIQVMYKPNKDYIGNDISKNTFERGEKDIYSKCFDSCLINPSCKGFVTDFEQGNTDNNKRYNCWLKSKMNNSTNDTNSNKRYSTIFPR